MTEPATPTGQAILAHGWFPDGVDMPRHLARIEQEAAAAERERLRQAIDGLRTWSGLGEGPYWDETPVPLVMAYEEVMALLSEPTP